MPFQQPPIPPTPPGTTLQGKTVLITGGNSGIGLEAARQFLTLKASRVIITARDKSKGEAAVATLRDQARASASTSTKTSSAVIDVFDLDLDDYQSALRFCDRVKNEVPYLDVLVCNGGVSLMEYQSSKSGHERVMQVNCYTHFLIILELLPLLQATRTHRKTGHPSSITFTGSAMQKLTSLASKRPLQSTESVLSHFDNKGAYSAMTRYADSKLLVNAFVRRLATLVDSEEVIVNNFCPGMVSTAFDKNAPLWIRVLANGVRALRGRSVEVGARTLVYATAVVGRESHGKFLASNDIVSGTPFLDQAAGKDFVDRLWTDVLAELVSLDPSLKRWA